MQTARQPVASHHRHVRPFDADARQVEPSQQVHQRFVVAAIDGHHLRIRTRVGRPEQLFHRGAVPEIDDQMQLVLRHHRDAGRPGKIRQVEEVREVGDDQGVQFGCPKLVTEAGVADGESVAKRETHEESYTALRCR